MRRRLIFASAALVAAAATALAAYSCDRRVRVGEDWTPERLQAELAKAGQHWTGQRYLGGLLLRRDDCPLPWSDLASIMATNPRQLSEVPGAMWATRLGGHNLVPEHSYGLMGLHPLTIRAHPDTLREITELFAP